MTSAFTTVTVASTGNGQRRSNAIGPHATNARRTRCPRSCGADPATRASTTSAVDTANTAVASHWRSAYARGLGGGSSASAACSLATALLATALTVTSASAEHIGLEDDGPPAWCGHGRAAAADSSFALARCREPHLSQLFIYSKFAKILVIGDYIRYHVRRTILLPNGCGSCLRCRLPRTPGGTRISPGWTATRSAGRIGRRGWTGCVSWTTTRS